MPTSAEIVLKLTRGYEKGIYTRLEMLSQLVEAAAAWPVVDLASALPSDWLADVKARTLSPPCSPDDGVYISGALLRDGIDPEEYFKEKRRLWHQGAWNWREFFAGAAKDRDP
jgi:hypothetical protein